MASFDIDLLKTFVTVKDTGGFSSAARHLHRTQSAVSMQVKRIESMIGHQVFNRNGRSITLTTEGEKLLPHARQMLKINDEAIAELITPEIEGSVRLGIADGYGTYFLPHVLSSFRQAHPRVQLELTCDLSGKMLKDLENGDLDLAILARDQGESGGEMLWCEPIVWVCASEVPVHKQDPIPLALFPHGCVLRASALSALEQQNQKWEQIYSSSSLAAVQAAVLAGLAVAVIGGSTVLPGMRTLNQEDGFPPLPSSIIDLNIPGVEPARITKRLAEHIRHNLKGWSDSPINNGSDLAFYQG